MGQTKREASVKFIDDFTDGPRQLRKTRATEIRSSEHGLEGAQVVLGHRKADVTQIYAQRDLRKAIEIAKESG